MKDTQTKEEFKGKDIVDTVSQRLYSKDWESLVIPQSKYRASAVALQETLDDLAKQKQVNSELTRGVQIILDLNQMSIVDWRKKWNMKKSDIAPFLKDLLTESTT